MANSVKDLSMDIHQNTKETQELVENIVSSSKKVVQVSGVVHSGVQEIGLGSREITASMQHMKEISHNIHTTSEELMNEVGEFKTE